MSTPLPTSEKIREATLALGRALTGIQYAVIGGAAGIMIGSTRLTYDVDIVVPRGATRAARALLQSDESFEVDGRTLHTFYKSTPRIAVEILAPPMLFKGEFTEDTPVYVVEGVRLLKPTLLLNIKCRSILERADVAGKTKDASDIQFLLRWCVAQELLPAAAADVSNASGEFIDHFVVTYGMGWLWDEAGFEHEKRV